jgi:hypothetical protein
MFVFLSLRFSSFVLFIAFDIVDTTSNWCIKLLACIVLSADARGKIGWNTI